MRLPAALAARLRLIAAEAGCSTNAAVREIVADWLRNYRWRTPQALDKIKVAPLRLYLEESIFAGRSPKGWRAARFVFGKRRQKP